MNDVCVEAIAAYRNAYKADQHMASKGLTVPERWLHCPNMSSLIADTFIVCKTMLDQRYDNLVAEDLRFNWRMLSSSIQAKYRRKIAMVVDLTNTDRFYDKNDIERSGCLYVKVGCRGHGESPSDDQVEKFKEAVQQFSDQNQIICVHCTHGFNRSGYMVASYLTEVFKYDVETALRTFAKARSPGIYKKQYIDDLIKRCKLPGEDVTFDAPDLPDWHVGFDDTDSNRKKRTNAKLKETRFMDGQIDNVHNVTDLNEIKEIQKIVSGMCSWGGRGFPGSQPVSMDRKNIELLSQQEYRVSWKADGQRYLMLIKGRNEVYMLDRDYAVYRVNNIVFPRRKVPHEHLTGTLLDGEMIIDNYEDCERGRFLAYDIIRFENQEVYKVNFNTRSLCISKEIVGPRNDLFMRGGLDKRNEPFSIRAKDFWDITQTRKILDGNFSKQLLHKIDGLIFQPVEGEYTFGQSAKILKWKPHDQNSIDFRLVVKRKSGEGLLPETVGELYVGGHNPPFCQIKVTNQLRQYNNKIIECCLDQNTNRWMFMRVRTDKSFPNKITTALAVMESIKNPVTKQMLYDKIDRERYAKDRPRVAAVNGNVRPSNGVVRPPSGGSTSSSSSHCSSTNSVPLKRSRDADPLGLCSDLHPEPNRPLQFQERHNIPVNNDNRMAFQNPNHFVDPLGLQSLAETDSVPQRKKSRYN